MTDDDTDDIDALFADLTANTLADVDARKMCECPCTTEGNRHSDRRCGNHATEFVTVHRIGYCTDPDPGADDDGNHCAMMCTRCARYSEQAVIAGLRQARAAHRGATPGCPTCNRPLVEASDVMNRRKL